MEYDLIVVDPPWSVKKTGRRKSRPNQGRSLDYKTMAMDEIEARDYCRMKHQKYKDHPICGGWWFRSVGVRETVRREG